jgi:hypothetical protein
VDAGSAGGAGGSVGGFGGGFFGGGMGGGGGSGSCDSVPIGFWTFDDCNTDRTDLSDSSFQGHSAFRNVDLTCVAGQEGQAASFAAKEDLVYAPDQPDFVLDQGVTIAAWVKPSSIAGTYTIARKRDGSDSAFALMINAKSFQFVVKLTSGKLVSISMPAKAGVWTHVAATYDGNLLRLFKNGVEAKHASAAGTLVRGAGPLLMGNDVNERRLPGQLDSVWFNTLAAPDDTIMGLTCIHAPPTVSVTPAVGPSVATGTPVTYTLSIANHNSASCQPESFATFVSVPSDFTVNPQFSQTAPIAGGSTGSMTFDVASGDVTDAGTYTLDFQVFGSTSAQAQASYVVVDPPGCHVSPGRELTIRDVSVVDDPIRTSMVGPANDARVGAWTFGRMMERLSPSAAAAADNTEQMFQTFLTPQTVNSFTIDERPAMDPVVLQPWPRTQAGKLDLAQAPMRLLAIVNRLDLQDLSKGRAGEGRLVYGVLDSFGNRMEFTVILEYALPAKNATEAKAWADAFHALQALPFPSEQYNAALQALTDKFSARNALPGAPNGSALIDIRTNEIALSFQWQLREFHISPTTGLMVPAPLFLTPDSSFNFGDTLARFINQNESAIVAEKHDVPVSFENAPFQAASVFNNFDFWDAPGISNPEARHKFSLNTCNGCHGAETQTGFLQISPRDQGQASILSGFLTGIDVSDPVDGTQRRLSELKRRRDLMESVVCP